MVVDKEWSSGVVNHLVNQLSDCYPTPSPNYWSPLTHHLDNPLPFREADEHGKGGDGEGDKAASKPLPPILKDPATARPLPTGDLPAALPQRVRWRNERALRQEEQRASNKRRRRELRKAALEEERWFANYNLINAQEELDKFGDVKEH